MPLYITGILGIVEVNNIKGKDSTEDFTYYRNFIEYEDKNGDAKVLEINSKTDFRLYKAYPKTWELRAYKQKAEINRGGELREASLYRLSLVGVVDENDHSED